jgi:hypothetical protein
MYGVKAVYSRKGHLTLDGSVWVIPSGEKMKRGKGAAGLNK